MNKLGDISLNSKWYRVSQGRSKDLTDVSPRGTGTQAVSELGLYQPTQQTDWRHGFGWHRWQDEMGYQSTTGSIDTRHEGIVQMFTAPTSSDTDNNTKEGFVTWNNKVWAWGAGGIRKYESATWATATVGVDTVEGTVTLQPSADTSIISSTTTTNYGSAVTIDIGEDNASASVRRALLKFDLSQIPANATITSAVLSLYISVDASSNTRDVSVYRMLKEWKVAEATWTRRVVGTNWVTAGGREATDSEATAIATTSVTDAATGWIDFDLTDAKVQEWAAGTLTNNGVIIQAATETSDLFKYHSSQYVTDTTLRPKLVLIYTTPAQAGTGAVNHMLPAGDFLFYAADGTRIRKISKEGLDSQAGNDSAAIDYSWMVLHNGFIYAGKDGTNRVHRDSTSDLSDLEGTTADPDVIYVGVVNDAYETIGAISYAGNLYVSRGDGLWMIGEDLIARRVLDFSAEASSDNFRGMVVHNGYLLFPIRDRFYQWNGARLSDITPPRITDTFPYTTYGRFDNLTAAGKFMYCTARTNETTYKEELLAWDGVAWHKLATLVPSGTDTVTGMGYDAVNNYLWYHVQATADVTYYIRFQNQSDFPYATFATTGTHDLTTSKMDMGFIRVKKSTPSFIFEVSNVSATQYITASYSIDGAAFVSLGNLTSNGINEISLSTTIEYYHIRLKFAFVTATATSSPVLESLIVRFLLRPEEFYGWSYTIPIAKGQDVGVSQQSRPTHEVIADLKTARTSKAPLAFIDEYGDTYKVYVTSLTTEVLEWDKDEGGIYPNVEKVVQLSLTEAN